MDPGIDEAGRLARDVRLRPGLSCLTPEPGRMQIGLSRGRGIVLHGVRSEDAELIESLRRPRPGRARRLTARSRRLLELLSEAGVVSRPSAQPDGELPARCCPDARVWSLAHGTGDDGEAVLRGRAARSVSVVGAGRLGATLATTLAAAGIGSITVVDRFRVSPGDVAPAGAGEDWLDRFRRDAVAERVRQSGAEARTAVRLDLDAGVTDLVVLVEHAVADATAADHLLSADVPHLSVVVREAEVVVGPLVVPGDGPCLRCLDLHRTDRDPVWPATVRELLSGRDRGWFATGAEEAAVSTTAAGLAAVQALAQLDAATLPAPVPPPARGATLEIELPGGLVARRVWPVHPRCGCHRLGPSAERRSAGQGRMRA